MVDFRELAVKRIIENSRFENEDLEIIGKIHNLANDSLVSRIEEEDYNYLSSSSYYKIYLHKSMKGDGISSFLSDHELKANNVTDACHRAIPYFVIRTRDRGYYIEFPNQALYKDGNKDIFRDDGEDTLPF